MPQMPIRPLLLALVFSGVLSAQSATTSGQFTAEPPTLVSLGFEWRITGDDNRNAKVEATYRKRGESAWRPALPLMRVQREEIGAAPPSGTGAVPISSRCTLMSGRAGRQADS